MNRSILLLTFMLCLGLAGCGEDNPCSGGEASCSFEGCESDGDCTGDQVCYQRDGSGYGVRCEEGCDSSRSYCAAPQD